MNLHNGFFKRDDVRSEVVAGLKLPEQWWSRPYEYAWALQFARPADIVADMGTGWMYRPFKDALADICGFVYAIDADERLLSQTVKENMCFLIANMTERVPLDDNSLDKIFCISVLEDLDAMVNGALREFARLLRPKGSIVTTFDVQYDMSKPLGRYPGVNFEKLLGAMDDNGLMFDGDVVMDKQNAVYHEEFNLCCFHAVMVKK